jgi:hypothetical protein
MSIFPSQFSITEIANWPASEFVELPKVQRGFVWKPNQIEDLWDSLLRGYPIGAFVLSPKTDSGMEVLDGQQRATSICLGFGNKTFRDKTAENIRVFIDIEEPDDEDARMYYFRVITKSHPWGYQRINNSKTLDSKSKRKAMDLYDYEDILNPDLDHFFPYDASVPIPFHYFLESALVNNSKEQLLESIKNWNFWDKIIAKWLNERKENNKGEFPISSLEKIGNRIFEIFEAVKSMLAKQQIPALYMKLDDFKKNLRNGTDESELDIDLLENEYRNDEIENLFIRLNAGGTPLRGEELNYSILKAHLPRNMQLLIEDGCEGFSRPARFITIAYRLFLQHTKNQGRERISMKIKPKQFQKTISDKLIEFQPFLIGLITDEYDDGLTLIGYAKRLLEFSEKNKNLIGLPHSIVSSITDSAPEVMFILLYRLMSGDKITINTELHRRMLGIVTLFYWLGKGEKQKDHSVLLKNIWPAAKQSNTISFWSSATVKRGMLDGVIPAIPTYNKSRDRDSLQQFKRFPFQARTDLFHKYDTTTAYGRFADKIFFNRDLILYSQRKFLSDIFDKKLYDLDDTNLPFDWDHICPQRLIHKKPQIPNIIKVWYQSIGNLRAWPYSLNRIDQDTCPAKKLDPLNRKWFDEDTQSDLDISKGKWSNFIGLNKHMILHENELNNKLLSWSFCQKSWLECDVEENIKKHYKQVFTLIRDRSLDMIGKWYQDLEIDKLIPERTEIVTDLFKKELDNRYWSLNPSWIKKKEHEFSISDRNFWVSKSPIRLKDSTIYMYISFSKDATEVIDEEDLCFGIYDSNNGSLIKSLNLTDNDLANDESDFTHYIQAYFTLISTETESCIHLLTEIRNWIQNSSLKTLKSILLDAFTQSIRAKKLKL